MKELKNILTSLMAFAFVYLMASFYSLTFDISKWSEYTRAVVAAWGGLFTIGTYIISKTKNNT